MGEQLETEPNRHLPHGSPAFEAAIAARHDAEVQQVLRLAASLCAIPGVTVPPEATAFDALARTVTLVRRWAEDAGLRVVERPADEASPYPFLLLTLQQHDLSDPSFDEALALIGHLDVVPAARPEQFAPYLAGDELFARGAADMKTVVASYLVWLARLQATPGPRPPLLLLLSCCEENGSHRPHHTGSVLRWLRQHCGVTVRFAIVGERTGELEWMVPDPPVGPICKENRAWRWLRLESPTERGIAALPRVAALVARGRTTVQSLNDSGGARAGQPGVRSGLVNPFVRLAADEGVADLHGAAWLVATRKAGGAIHSAAASTAEQSVVERLAALAQRACTEFGEQRVRLAGLAIGQDGNFNTYDGAGQLRLAVLDTPVALVARWADGFVDTGLELAVHDAAATCTEGPAIVGLDIRELLAHRVAVAQLIEALCRDHLADARCERFIDVPAWRCPATHPDLVRLEAAYAAVMGAPSPDLVKLHGNDGGHLAALQQAEDPRLGAAGEAHVVVFGQTGRQPHGAQESHRAGSIRPYLDILDRWVAALGEP